MPPKPSWLQTLPHNLISGVVVFLVALPFCLGMAESSRADSKAGGHGLPGESKQAHASEPTPADKQVPRFAGLIAGIVGGVVVGAISGSHTSVSGPAAGLTAVVAAQVLKLGSFQAFLLALLIAGVFQIILGLVRAGFLAKYFPNAVIKGLLAAVGLILILKQLPHLLGHDGDPEGDFSFFQPDQRNTFTEILDAVGDIAEDFRPAAVVIGLASVAFLLVWDKVKVLKTSPVPAPLLVVLFGVGLGMLFDWLGGSWTLQSRQGEPKHLVDMPINQPSDVLTQFVFPDWSQWANGAVWTAAVVIAVVASLETLINLEAVDKLDPKRRDSPSSRELVAQGVGNVVCGLVGGLPVTSDIVRSSANINAGGRSKVSAICHGGLLGVCVVFAAFALNKIPLSCLAAILIMTGLKLVSVKRIRQMWKEGWQQFLPFAVTVVAILFTDLLVGVIVGLLFSVAFILRSNMRRPLERVVERHLGGEVVRINLANQVSFLNRAALAKALDAVPEGGHLLLDATQTDYIDPDILDLIHEFHTATAPARGVKVSLSGFQEKYAQLTDRTLFVDYSSREVQDALTPAQVLQVLRDGNERFRSGRRLTRDLGRQVAATAAGQHPLAVLLTCIDSRSPAELLFDLGLGDIFVTRIAGNVSGTKIFGSMEYATAVAGAKLVVVLGHTQCGAVRAAVELTASGSGTPPELHHLGPVLDQLRVSAEAVVGPDFAARTPDDQQRAVDDAARRNVLKTVADITSQSATIRRLVDAGTVAVVGAMYDIATGRVEFFTDLKPQPLPANLVPPKAEPAAAV